jgi:hypothetical protein
LIIFCGRVGRPLRGEAVAKLVDLALRMPQKRLAIPIVGSMPALRRFAVLFEERFTSTIEKSLAHSV